MKIFIAGGTGVVGRRAVPMLVAAGHSVTAIGRTPDKRAALTKQGVTAVAASLFDPDQLKGALVGHQTVINLATAMPSSSSLWIPGAWRPTARLRSIGAANLAAAAREAGAIRFIQESFAPIYADAGDKWIDEESEVRPARYNRAVVDAERTAGSFTSNDGFGVVLRYSFLYGPDSHYLHDALANVRKGRAPAFGPDTYISSISHDDAATAVVAALSLPAGIYNVTDDEPVTKREYYRVLSELLGVPEPQFLRQWMSKLLGSLGETLARSQRISNHKLRDMSAWKPRFPSVREGLRDAISKRRRT